MLPPGYQFQSETIRKSIEQGRAEARASTVLEVLEARGLAITPAQREQILGTKDLDTLTRWVRRAATVASAHVLFE